MGGGFESKPGGRSLIQAISDNRGVGGLVPGKQTLIEQLGIGTPNIEAADHAVQRKAVDGGDAALTATSAQAQATQGVAGAASSLPHSAPIQRAFGRHDISATKARVGGAAAEASDAIGAMAYTQGDRVGFASAPDLHTAAHEAAHVVQQRGGVQLKGGIDGGAADPYERHADSVADAVVAGHSAEGLLDAGLGGHAGAGPAVQRKDDPAAAGAAPRTPSPASAKPADGKGHAIQAPDLQGAPYQWVSGTFNLWVSAEWFRSAPDFAMSGGQWVSPSRIRELLGVLHDRGVLTWASPDRIAKASGNLGIEPGEAPVVLIHLRTSAFDAVGLPPGASAIVGKTSGRGLDVVIAVPDVHAPEGKQFLLSQPAKHQLITALEGFTHLAMIASERQRIVSSELKANLGAGTALFNVSSDTGQQLFGKAAYDRWYDGSIDKQAELQFDHTVGGQTFGDVGSAGPESAGHGHASGTKRPGTADGEPTRPTDKATAEVERTRALYEKLRKAFPETVELRGATAWPAFLAFVADHAEQLAPFLHGHGARAASLDDLQKLVAQFEQHKDAKDGDTSGDVGGHADGKQGGSAAGTKDGDIRTTRPDGIKDGSIYGEADGDKYGSIRWVPKGTVQLHPTQPTYVTGSSVKVEVAWDFSVHPDAGLILLPNHCDFVWTVRHNGTRVDSAGHSIFANDRSVSLDLGKDPGVYTIDVVATSKHFKTEHHRFSSSVTLDAVSEQAFDRAAFEAATVAGPNAAFSRDDHGSLHAKPGETVRMARQEIGGLDLNKGSIDAFAKQGKITGGDHDIIVGQLAKQREALKEIEDKTKDDTPYVVRGTFVGRDDSSTLPLHLLMHMLRRTEANGVASYDLILHDTTLGSPIQHPGSARRRVAGQPPGAAYGQLELAALEAMTGHFHAHNDYPSGTVHLAAQQLTSDAVWEKTLDTNNGRKKAKKVLGTMAAIGGIALMVVPGGSVVSVGLMVVSSAAGIASVALDVEDRIAKEGELKADRRLVMDVLQVAAVALPFGTLTKTLAAASTVGKGRFLLCMTSLDAAQGFVIAADVRATLAEIDANTAAQLATATSDDQRRQLLAERDRQVAETIGGAMVNGAFLLVSLGRGIKNTVAITRTGAAYTVRQPVHELAKQGRAPMEQALATDTFEHNGERVQLTAEERRYLEHEITMPEATAKPTDAAAHQGTEKQLESTEVKPEGSHARNDADPQSESQARSAAARGLRQKTADLDALYRDAAVAHEQLAQATQDIASNVGGQAVVPPLKGKARAVEKTQADYDGDYARVTDLVRSTVVCDNMEQVNKAVATAQTRTKVVRMKNRFDQPVDGYRDILLNVELPNGHIGELQIQLRGMLKAKDGIGHKLFEKIRTIEARAAIEHRDLIPEERTARAEYQAQMKQLYDAAFESANTPKTEN